MHGMALSTCIGKRKIHSLDVSGIRLQFTDSGHQHRFPVFDGNIVHTGRNGGFDVVVGKSQPSDLIPLHIRLFLCGSRNLVSIRQLLHIRDTSGSIDMIRIELVMNIAVLFGCVLRIGQGGIGAVARVNVASCIIHIPRGIVFICQCVHLVDDRCPVLQSLIGIGTGDRQSSDVGQNMGSGRQGSFRHLQPALGILGILFIVLGQFCHRCPKRQRPDRNDGIRGGPVNFFPGGDLGENPVLIYLVIIDIVHGVIRHDPVGDAHLSSPPYPAPSSD